MLIFLINRIFPPASSLRRIALVMFWAFALNFIFGLAFYFAERGAQEGLTLLDSIWWAMVSMTTVGYGDYFAQTTAGRFLVSYPTFLLGIGLLGYFLGAVADAVIKGASARRKGLKRIMKSEHILICGYPSLTKVLQIVLELREVDAYRRTEIVLITDAIEELPEQLVSEGVLFVRGRPQSEDVLRKAGIERCHGAFVLAEKGDMEDADAQTFTTSSIIESIGRECGRDIRVISELIGRQNVKMMQRSSVDGIVSHEGITDCLLVQEFLSPGVNQIFHQIITNQIGSQFHILNTRLEGRKIRDLQFAALEHPTNLQVIGLVKDGKFLLNPSSQHTITAREKLIILAEKSTDFEDIEDSILQSTDPANPH